MTTTRTKRGALWYAVNPMFSWIVWAALFAANCFVLHWVEKNSGEMQAMVVWGAEVAMCLIVAGLIIAHSRYQSYLKGGE